MGAVDTDAEDDLMRHVSSPARVYRDLMVSETDDALCFDATAPKLGTGAGTATFSNFDMILDHFVTHS